VKFEVRIKRIENRAKKVREIIQGGFFILNKLLGEEESLGCG